MLVNTYAGFNMEMAVITNDPVKTWNTIFTQYHRKVSFDILEFAGLVFSWLPYNKYYKVGVKTLNQDQKNLDKKDKEKVGIYYWE